MSGGFAVWSSGYEEGFCVIGKLKGFKEQWLLLQGLGSQTSGRRM